jgi:hypothetical protein
LSVLDKVRRWIDGETAELVLEEAARDAQVKPRSEAEEFIVKIARAIESVMQKEMLPLPQGTAIIPTEYTIFLSDTDDKEWQGVKRRGLEQGLYHILAERAREIAGKKKLETKSFVIELRIDGTLEKGEVRVQHSWEESSSNKTGVLARPKPAVQPSGGPSPSKQPTNSPLNSGRPYSPPSHVQPPNFTGRQGSNLSARPTVPSANVQKAIPVVSDEAEIMTNVKPRVAELYKLEIWLNGVRQNIVPIFNKEITVGRGSKSKPVDISLSGDPEISRRHLKMITDGAGNYWVINEGRNPAMIANYELPEGQRVPLVPGTSLVVCSYILRIQP